MQYLDRGSLLYFTSINWPGNVSFSAQLPSMELFFMNRSLAMPPNLGVTRAIYGFLLYPHHPELQIRDTNRDQATLLQNVQSFYLARRRPGEKPNILAQLQRGLFNHPGPPKKTIAMMRHTAWNHLRKLLKRGTGSCHKFKFLKILCLFQVPGLCQLLDMLASFRWHDWWWRKLAPTTICLSLNPSEHL